MNEKSLTQLRQEADALQSATDGSYEAANDAFWQAAFAAYPPMPETAASESDVTVTAATQESEQPGTHESLVELRQAWRDACQRTDYEKVAYSRAGDALHAALQSANYVAASAEFHRKLDAYEAAIEAERAAWRAYSDAQRELARVAYLQKVGL